MPREHGDKGEFVETVALDDVLSVFDHVDGPVVLSADVADALGCTTETARRKLKRLHERGDLDRRKVARRVLYWRASEPAPSERRETVETPAEGTAEQSDSPPAPDEHSPSPVDVTTLSFDRDLTAGRREQLEAWLHHVAKIGGSVTKSDFADWWTDARTQKAGYNAQSFWEAFAKAAMKQADEFVKPNARSYRFHPGDQNTADPLNRSGPYDPTDEFDT